MIIFIDIDETICEHPNTDPSKPREYAEAVPINKNIEKVNRLYDDGHEITYWTARGANTGIDWTDLTTKQLGAWGAKYHFLKLNKPYFDLFIDDKVINARTWEREDEENN